MDIFNISFFISALSAFLIGFYKAGIPNTGVLSITLMMSFFPCRFSLGVLLPLLLLGDLNAIYCYQKYLNYKEITKVLKVVLLGMFSGAFFFVFIENDDTFKMYVGLCLLLLSSLKFLIHIKPCFIKRRLKPMWRFIGLLGGFFTVISHTGGPFIALGLLFKKHSKEEFLCLYATLFLIINSLKIPLLLFSESLNKETLTLSLLGSPFVFIGAYLGYRLIPYLSKELFSLITTVIIFLTAVFFIVW